MGRKPFEEELKDYQEKHALDVPDDIEMLSRFKAELYRRMTSGTLGDTAFVNGLRAVAQMAEEARSRPAEVETETRGVDDILKDAGLPRDRRIEIGRAEIERLRERTSSLQLLVAQIEGER